MSNPKILPPLVFTYHADAPPPPPRTRRRKQLDALNETILRTGPNGGTYCPMHSTAALTQRLYMLVKRGLLRTDHDFTVYADARGGSWVSRQRMVRAA